MIERMLGLTSTSYSRSCDLGHPRHGHAQSFPLLRSSRTQARAQAASGSTRGKTGTSARRSASKSVDGQELQSPSKQKYFNVTGYPFPLGPVFQRQTYRREIDPGSIWVFEQAQSLVGGPSTSVRMTVVKLKSGGLWVHAPVAPTAECLALLKELDAPVEYIVLPTFAYEHKIFVGPFSRKFPKAKVYVAPSQWSWPINLPAQFFGIFPTGILTEDAVTPWADEIKHKVFKSSVGIGPYIEVAFYLKKSRTLLVTDAVIFIPQQPPEVVRSEDLVSAASSNFFIKVLSGSKADVPLPGVPLKPRELTPAVQDLGWRRMVLQILYIVPGDLRDPTKGFTALANKLIVSPIVKTLVFTTSPAATREWVDAITRDWPFRRIIPAHFTAPVDATPAQFRAAFAFAYDQGRPMPARAAPGGGFLQKLFAPGKPAVTSRFEEPEEDIAALKGLKRALQTLGVANK